METTRPLADFAIHTTFEKLPSEVVHQTKRVLLDCVACALAATRTDKGRIVLEVGRELGGSAEVTIWGDRHRAPLTTAAFVNAELTNTMDLDEVLLNWGHISPYVMPPAVALAERERARGCELVRAMAIGYEVAARIGGALTAVVLLKGCPPQLETTIPPAWGYGFGAFGAATAAGLLLGLNVERMLSALGIAGHSSQVPGCMKWSHSPPVAMHKYALAGLVAHTGLVAALLARRGFTGDPSVLDGERGYWRFVGSDFWAPELVLEALGARWSILETSFKLYPCCRYIHHSMDLVARLVAENALKPDEIETIDVRLFSRAAGTSVFAIRELRDHMDIQFSVSYTIAAAALGLHRGPRLQSPETLADPRLHELARKVHVDVDPRVAEVRYHTHGLRPVQAIDRLPATVAIRARGSVFRAEGEYALGDPWTEATRLSDEDLRAKFRDCADGVLDRPRQERVIELIEQLEKLRELDELFASLRAVVPA
ncbi:MAG: MmgE/PrpD family protein [Candidatus Rokubacteria bacterium]|nr:MmgE/PrpD family protein [Candidatus Rokubacteria bacterium]